MLDDECVAVSVVRLARTGLLLVEQGVVGLMVGLMIVWWGIAGPVLLADRVGSGCHGTGWFADFD